jgi:calcineurin-like phosphoesterase family protein
MDDQLINYWNFQIAPGDTVYHLGDIIFRSAKDPTHYLRRLNGKIRLLVGNHDLEVIKRHADLFDSIDPLLTIKIDLQRIVNVGGSGVSGWGQTNLFQCLPGFCLPSR